MIWWILLIIVICIGINIFINILAKKKNCYEYMMTISTKEAKMAQYLILFTGIIITTVLLEIFGAFKHYEVFIGYLIFIVILAITSSKISKFIFALYLVKTKTVIDTSISGKEKDKRDNAEDMEKMRAALTEMAQASSKNTKTKKLRNHSFDGPEKQALKSGEQDEWNFEEEELEEDDYYSEDE